MPLFLRGRKGTNKNQYVKERFELLHLLNNPGTSQMRTQTALCRLRGK